MTLAQVARGYRQRWATVVAGAALGGLAALGYFVLAPATYESSTALFATTTARTPDGQIAPEMASSAEDRVRSYARLATSEQVLEAVISDLKLPVTTADLGAHIRASADPGTVLIDVRARDSEPGRARDIAAKVAEHLPKVVQRLESTDESAVDAPITVRVTTSAAVPSRPASPDRNLALLIGLLAGTGGGVLGAAAQTLGDRRLRNRVDIAEQVGLPVLSEIPEHPQAGLAGFTGPDPFGYAEAYRRLRSHLHRAPAGRSLGAILVTSARGDEGRTTTATNLALALAHGGQKVVLIDADLRRPGVDVLLGTSGPTGLSALLAGTAPLATALQRWGRGVDLRVITAGPAVSNPGDLLTSARMASLVEAFVANGLTVVLDAPALSTCADAAGLARISDAVLLVVRSGAVTAKDVGAASAELRALGASLLGIALNRTAAPAAARRRAHGGHSAPSTRHRGRKGSAAVEVPHGSAAGIDGFTESAPPASVALRGDSLAAAVTDMFGSADRPVAQPAAPVVPEPVADPAVDRWSVPARPEPELAPLAPHLAEPDLAEPAPVLAELEPTTVWLSEPTAHPESMFGAPLSGDGFTADEHDVTPHSPDEHDVTLRSMDEDTEGEAFGDEEFDDAELEADAEVVDELDEFYLPAPADAHELTVSAAADDLAPSDSYERRVETYEESAPAYDEFDDELPVAPGFPVGYGQTDAGSAETAARGYHETATSFPTGYDDFGYPEQAPAASHGVDPVVDTHPSGIPVSAEQFGNPLFDPRTPFGEAERTVRAEPSSSTPGASPFSPAWAPPTSPMSMPPSAPSPMPPPLSAPIEPSAAVLAPAPRDLPGLPPLPAEPAPQYTYRYEPEVMLDRTEVNDTLAHRISPDYEVGSPPGMPSLPRPTPAPESWPSLPSALPTPSWEAAAPIGTTPPPLPPPPAEMAAVPVEQPLWEQSWDASSFPGPEFGATDALPTSFSRPSVPGTYTPDPSGYGQQFTETQDLPAVPAVDAPPVLPAQEPLSGNRFGESPLADEEFTEGQVTPLDPAWQDVPHYEPPAPPEGDPADQHPPLGAVWATQITPNKRRR